MLPVERCTQTHGHAGCCLSAPCDTQCQCYTATILQPNSTSSYSRSTTAYWQNAAHIIPQDATRPTDTQRNTNRADLQHAPPTQPTKRPPSNTQTQQPKNTNQPRHRPPTHPHRSTSPSNHRQRGLTRQRASRSRGEHPLHVLRSYNCRVQHP